MAGWLGPDKSWREFYRFLHQGRAKLIELSADVSTELLVASLRYCVIWNETQLSEAFSLYVLLCDPLLRDFLKTNNAWKLLYAFNAQ